MGFTRKAPATSAELRQRLYQGELFLFEASSETRRLVDAALDSIDNAFEMADPRTASEDLGPDAFFEVAGRLRRQIYTEPVFHGLVAQVVESMGFAPHETGFDPARLRMVLPHGHENPAAAAMYYGHRDTWYANPQAMVTWWIPLVDVDESNSFSFFPDHFDAPVANDSEIFNFQEWVAEDDKKLIGWQDNKTGLTARYPQLLEEPTGTKLPVVCNRGDLLLFAGQHLHRTHKQTTALTRYSLDFRTVDLPDHQAGRQAANVDNRSTGSWNKKFGRVDQVGHL